MPQDEWEAYVVDKPQSNGGEPDEWDKYAVNESPANKQPEFDSTAMLKGGTTESQLGALGLPNTPVSNTTPVKDAGGYSWEKPTTVIGHSDIPGETNAPAPAMAKLQAISQALDIMPNPYGELGKVADKAFLNSVTGTVQGLNELGNVDPTDPAAILQYPAAVVKTAFSAAGTILPSLMVFNSAIEGAGEIVPDKYISAVMSPLSTLLQNGAFIIPTPGGAPQILPISNGTKAAAELGDVIIQGLMFKGFHDLAMKVKTNSPLTPMDRNQVAKAIDEAVTEYKAPFQASTLEKIDPDLHPDKKIEIAPLIESKASTQSEIDALNLRKATLDDSMQDATDAKIKRREKKVQDINAQIKEVVSKKIEPEPTTEITNSEIPKTDEPVISEPVIGQEQAISGDQVAPVIEVPNAEAGGVVRQTETNPIAESGKEEITNNVEQPESRATGISIKAREATAENLNMEAAASGHGWTGKEALDRGNELLSQGIDPNEMITSDLPLHDKVAIAQAHANRLGKETNIAGDTFGLNSKEYSEAAQKESDYLKDVKHLSTLSHLAFAAHQGQVDVDTGSWTGLVRAFEEKAGRKATNAEVEKLKQAAIDSKKATDELNIEYQNKIKELDKQIVENAKRNEKSNQGKYAERTKAAADTFRKLKGKPFVFTDSNGVEHQVHMASLWDDAIELGAKAIEASGIIADGVAKVISHVKDTDWYKKFNDQDQQNFAKQLEQHYQTQEAVKSELTAEEKNIERLQKRLDDLQAGKVNEKADKRENTPEEADLKEQIRIATDRANDAKVTTQFTDKTDSKFSPEEAKDIWEYAKRNYLIDNLADFDHMIRGVSTDLGLTTDQVRDALSQPKSKSLATDSVYLKRRRQQQMINQAKQLVEQANTSGAHKWFKALTSFFFEKAIAFHGTVGLITHAGMNIFRPDISKTWAIHFFKQFENAFGSISKFEQRKADFQSSPEYAFALRNGLKIDPNKVTDDYGAIKKFFKKINAVGDRGFFTLKEMRLALFNHDYNRLSDAEKADQNTARLIAQISNHATGTSDFVPPEWMNVVTFAPRLEASKWARIVTDPAKAVSTLFRWDKASVADKAAAKLVAKKNAGILATYMSALATNYALNYAIGNPTPNLTDPSKKDWLKFRIGDHTIDLSGGIIPTLQFIGHLFTLPFVNKEDLTGSRKEILATTLTDYGLSKLSPIASTSKDFLIAHDFSGNTMPYSNDRPLHSYNHKLTWKEYILTNQLNIPLNEAMKATYQSMENRGMSDLQINDVLNGLIMGTLSGFTGARVGIASQNNPLADKMKEATKQYETQSIDLEGNGKRVAISSLDRDELKAAMGHLKSEAADQASKKADKTVGNKDEAFKIETEFAEKQNDIERLAYVAKKKASEKYSEEEMKISKMGVEVPNENGSVIEYVSKKISTMPPGKKLEYLRTLYDKYIISDETIGKILKEN